MPCRGFKNTRYMQYLAAATASLAVASNVMYATWPSPSLPKLTSEDSPIGTTVTGEEGSWIVSSFWLGGIISTLFSIPLIKKIGPKRTLLICAVFLTVPWIFIILCKSVAVICASRLVAGLATGITTTACTMYNAEIGDEEIRGRLSTAYTILRLTGSFVVLTTGPFVSYTVLGVICVMVPISCVSTFYFMPESPYHLFKTGQRERAVRSVLRLSGRNADETSMQKRLLRIENNVAEDMRNKSTIFELFSNEMYRKPFLIMLGVKTLHQLSGGVAIDSYMQSIIETSQSNISPEVSSIIFGAIQFPAAFTSAVFVDKFGRKPLLITSALGCAIALASEGTYFFIQDSLKGDLTYIRWIPTTAIVLFLIMAPLGVVSLPYVLLGELFPVNVREAAVGTITFYGVTLGFVVSKFFQPIAEAWGIHTVFWIFTGICSSGAVFVLLVLPETKGKTFAEIQAALKIKIGPNNSAKKSVC